MFSRLHGFGIIGNAGADTQDRSITNASPHTLTSCEQSQELYSLCWAALKEIGQKSEKLVSAAPYDTIKTVMIHLTRARNILNHQP